MNSAKRLILVAAVVVFSVLSIGLVKGSLEEASAAPPSPPSSGAQVTVNNDPSHPVPVQGSTTISGSIELSASANTVKLDQTGTNNTVKLADNTVRLDSNVNTVKVDSTSPVNVAGSVTVNNSVAGPLQVALGETVDVAGSVGINSGANTVKIDSTANTVKLDSNSVQLDPAGNTVKLADNTVKLDPAANSVTVIGSATNPLPVAQQGTVNVAGSVGLSPNANAVKIDSTANTVKLDSNTVKLDPAGNTVKLDSTGTMPVAGSVGINSDANTVKIDGASTNANPVKVWGWIGLDPTANNTVKVVNPSGQALNVNVVGGSTGGSAQTPVHFSSAFTSNFSWTNAYQVPAGKILKVEFVSVYAEADDLWPVVSVNTTMGGVTAEYWLPRLEAEWQQQASTASDIYSRGKYRMSTQVAFYADENTWVQSAGRCAMAACGAPSYRVTFSGYLMNK